MIKIWSKILCGHVVIEKNMLVLVKGEKGDGIYQIYNEFNLFLMLSPIAMILTLGICDVIMLTKLKYKESV